MQLLKSLYIPLDGKIFISVLSLKNVFLNSLCRITYRYMNLIFIFISIKGFIVLIIFKTFKNQKYVFVCLFFILFVLF